jgi:hypothetical protein
MAPSAVYVQLGLMVATEGAWVAVGLPDGTGVGACDPVGDELGPRVGGNETVGTADGNLVTVGGGVRVGAWEGRPEARASVGLAEGRIVKRGATVGYRDGAALG